MASLSGMTLDDDLTQGPVIVPQEQQQLFLALITALNTAKDSDALIAILNAFQELFKVTKELRQDSSTRLLLIREAKQKKKEDRQCWTAEVAVAFGSTLRCLISQAEVTQTANAIRESLFTTIAYPDGGSYIGELKGDGRRKVRHGFGTYKFVSGGVYKGEWGDNKKNGMGEYLWPAGEMYNGNWVDNAQYGHGMMTWVSGNQYIGEWKGNKMNGQGTFIYAKDGSTWTGIWVNGKKKE